MTPILVRILCEDSKIGNREIDAWQIGRALRDGSCAESRRERNKEIDVSHTCANYPQ